MRALSAAGAIRVASELRDMAVSHHLQLLDRLHAVEAAPGSRPRRTTSSSSCRARAREPTTHDLAYAGRNRRAGPGGARDLEPTGAGGFLMRHYQGCSIEEICSALDLRTTPPKHFHFRAVKKMRDALRPLMDVAPVPTRRNAMTTHLTKTNWSFTSTRRAPKRGSRGGRPPGGVHRLSDRLGVAARDAADGGRRGRAGTGARVRTRDVGAGAAVAAGA